MDPLQLMWIIVMFLLAKFLKSVPMRKQTHLHLDWPEGEGIFSKLSVLCFLHSLNVVRLLVDLYILQWKCDVCLCKICCHRTWVMCAEMFEKPFFPSSQYLEKELTMASLPFPSASSGVSMTGCSCVSLWGNDFLPHLPSLEIRYAYRRCL